MENFFIAFEEGNISANECEKQVKNMIEDWGFRKLWYFPMRKDQRVKTLDHPSRFIDEIEDALDEGGTIIYWDEGHTAGNGLTTFTAVRRVFTAPEGREIILSGVDGVVVKEKAWEIHIAIVNDYTQEFNETIIEGEWEQVADYLGFRYIPVKASSGSVVSKRIQLQKKPNSQSEYYFTNAVWIPQPYNVRFPNWLIEKIRKHLNSKTKL